MATKPYPLGDSVVVRGGRHDDGIDVVFKDGSGEPVAMEVTVSMDRETALDFADWIIGADTEEPDSADREWIPWG